MQPLVIEQWFVSLKTRSMNKVLTTVNDRQSGLIYMFVGIKVINSDEASLSQHVHWEDWSRGRSQSGGYWES